MSSLTPVERTERRRQQRRRELIRWGIRVLVVLLVFLLGVALGQAIQDNPTTGRTVTSDADNPPSDRRKPRFDHNSLRRGVKNANIWVDSRCGHA